MMLNNIANRANSQYKSIKPGIQNVAMDPATVKLFVEILIALVQVTDRYCRSTEVTQVCRRPTFRQRRLLNRIIRRKTGFRKYFEDGRYLEQAILQTGATLSSYDVAELRNEVRSK